MASARVFSSRFISHLILTLTIVPRRTRTPLPFDLKKQILGVLRLPKTQRRGRLGHVLCGRFALSIAQCRFGYLIGYRLCVSPLQLLCHSMEGDHQQEVGLNRAQMPLVPAFECSSRAPDDKDSRTALTSHLSRDSKYHRLSLPTSTDSGCDCFDFTPFANSTQPLIFDKSGRFGQKSTARPYSRLCNLSTFAPNS